ncbi:MAG TPA: outer membrane lipoprotein carrier protein LolA [Candidatus Binataceae bacterium]|nr:outer membrane lipoprotein carrier protein LolA [Candidatus Binataceae bacterium]
MRHLRNRVRAAANAPIVALCLLASVIGLTSSAFARTLEGCGSARSAALVSPTDLNGIVERLQHHYNCTASFTAAFVERISGAGGVNRTRNGVVFYQRGGLMRWDFAKPSEATVVSDGVTLYDYEKDLDQVVEMPVKRAFQSGATSFLLGLGDIRRDFNASLPGANSSGADDNGLIHLILTPKGGTDVVELGLDPTSFDLVTLRLTSQVGSVTDLKFSNIHSNVALNASLFKFKVPQGADIVTPGSS